MQYKHHEHKAKLCEALSQLQFRQPKFEFFPFTNELGFYSVIDTLANISPKQRSRMPVAILTGESNLISLLPELAKNVRVIICNDINPSINHHTQILVNFVRIAENREQFYACYLANCEHIGINKNKIDGQIDSMLTLVGQPYFLSSEERFQQCKLAAEQLTFVWTQVNLSVPSQVLQLATTLTQYGAKPVLINLSNIHHYCDCKILKKNINLLVSNQDDCFIMFSCGMTANDKKFLKTRVDTTNNYFELLDDTIRDSMAPEETTMFKASTSLDRFNLLDWVDKANKRAKAFTFKYCGTSTSDAPKIQVAEDQSRAGYRFFTLQKPRAKSPGNVFYKEMVTHLLSAFALKWFITQDDFTLYPSVHISFSFLLSFIDKTDYLERKMTQDDILSFIDKTDDLEKKMSQDDIMINRTGLSPV